MLSYLSYDWYVMERVAECKSLVGVFGDDKLMLGLHEVRFDIKTKRDQILHACVEQDGIRKIIVTSDEDVSAYDLYATFSHIDKLLMILDGKFVPLSEIQLTKSDTVEEREKALAELIPYQKGDFKAMYKVLKGLPMTVRYLDPPLHEFLPTEEKEIIDLAKDMGVTVEQLKQKCVDLHEFNPMMGHRGCRLDVTYPEIARMQTRALMEAAIEVKEEDGFDIIPEIMIPLVGEVKELKFVKDIVIETAEKVKKEKNSDINYHIGTMIEIPRAALTADDIAKEAEFFSFGTNDLTQMTFGFSRDDAGKFLGSYYENKIYEQDPFARLDQVGVGKLVEMAVEKGKTTRPDIKLGICGEHGGDPSSVEFFHKVGLDYVSCSPYRVPIARLAAAQAAIKSHQK